MPRRRNSPQLIVLDETTLDYDTQEPIRPLKDFLKNQVWNLYFDIYNCILNNEESFIFISINKRSYRNIFKIIKFNMFIILFFN